MNVGPEKNTNQVTFCIEEPIGKTAVSIGVIGGVEPSNLEVLRLKRHE